VEKLDVLGGRVYDTLQEFSFKGEAREWNITFQRYTSKGIRLAVGSPRQSSFLEPHCLLWELVWQDPPPHHATNISHSMWPANTQTDAEPGGEDSDCQPV